MNSLAEKIPTTQDPREPKAGNHNTAVLSRRQLFERLLVVAVLSGGSAPVLIATAKA